MLLPIGGLYRHTHVEHIDTDGSLSALDQQIVLRPVESGAVFHHGVGIVAKLQLKEKHIILVPEVFPLMGHIAAYHRNLGGGTHEELDTVQLVDMMIEVAAGLGPDLFPTNRGLLLLPAVPGGMTVEDLSDLAFGNELLGPANGAEEVHHVPRHENHAILLRGAYHLVTVGITQGDGLFTENVFFVPGSTENRLLMEVIGRSHNHSIYIRPGTQNLQISLQVAVKLLSNGRSIVRVQHRHHPGPFLLI